MPFARRRADSVDKLVAGVQGSLTRLGTDHLDVIQCHVDYPEPNTPVFIEGFRRLKEAGTVRAWGVSTSDLDQLRRFSTDGDCDVLERSARQRILMMRLGDAEHALLRRAAEMSGLTISGYAASASLAAAAGKPAPDDRQTERLMAELMATRAQLRRYDYNVNQIARTLNAGGEPPEWVSNAVELTDRAVARIDSAVADLSKSQGTH